LSGTCAKCLDDINNGTCAWCETSSECMNLTHVDTKCDLYESDNCTSPQEDACQQQEGCLSCVSLSASNGCGFCDNELCIQGNSSGPFDALCKSWYFGQNSTCSDIKCDDFSGDCFSCAAQTKCGFCNSTTCVAGNQTGPEHGTCSSYIFNATSTCGEEKLNCSGHGTCESCTGDKSERCGWCSSSRLCMEYDPNESGQPIGQSCEVWKPKTCILSCFDFKDCSSCQSNSNCGWCNTTLCTEGSNSGPLLESIVCELWGFNNCPYDCTALNVDQCTTCINHNECGWCDLGGAGSDCIQLTNASTCTGTFSNGTCQPLSYQCDEFTTCNQCVSYSQCSWCGTILGCTDYEPTCDLTGGCNPNNGNKRLTTSWIIVIIFAILIFIGGSIGGVAFYKVYWTKRHYYGDGIDVPTRMTT